MKKLMFLWVMLAMQCIAAPVFSDESDEVMKNIDMIYQMNMKNILRKPTLVVYNLLNETVTFKRISNNESVEIFFQNKGVVYIVHRNYIFGYEIRNNMIIRRSIIIARDVFYILKTVKIYLELEEEPEVGKDADSRSDYEQWLRPGVEPANPDDDSPQFRLQNSFVTGLMTA